MHRPVRTLPSFSSFRTFLAVPAVLVLGAASAGCGTASDPSSSTSAEDLSADSIGSRAGTVYTLTNYAADNQLVVYRRGSDGSLRPAATYSTGGLGSGTGLGSQSALFLNGDASWLFAVNAGSSELSAFIVDGETLRLVDCLPSGGKGPVSVTEHDGLVYVVNGGSGTISGFTRGSNGHLHEITGSTQSLTSATAGPAEIAFDHEGRTLFVTEKTTSLVDRFSVDGQGRAGAAVTAPSVGMTPFGFAVTGRDELVVSEAHGGAAGASTVSSYADASGTLTLVSSQVADTQSAACWINLAHGNTLAFASNTGSGTISTYDVGTDGSVSLSAASAATTGSGTKPEDMALSRDEKFLYVLEAGTGSIGVFALDASGGLTAVDSGVGGLPAGTSGLAAR